MPHEKVILLVRDGSHDKALDVLYQNFPAFQNSIVKAGGSKADAEDIFQDALLIFMERAMDPEFSLSCKIQTFLFGICKNLSLEYFRKKGRLIHIELKASDENFERPMVEQFLEKEQKYAALDAILSSIGRKCLEILSLFYLSDFKMADIARRMGFNSEASAKTQKYKCLEKARALSKDVMVELQTELS